MTTDQKLLQIVADPKPTTVDEVIERMNRLYAAIPSNDGLKWFNWLYRLVSEAVKSRPPAGGWKDERWVRHLDVVFARFYFQALESGLNGNGATPKSWGALFESRHKTGIDRIQFALAGMNAHINHDLSLALLQTDAELGMAPKHSSTEHDDFEHVNRILEGVLPEALNTLATGLLGEIAQSTGKIGRMLAVWNIRVARDLAWDFADHLHDLNKPARGVALFVQDKFTGALGRSLLLMI